MTETVDSPGSLGKGEAQKRADRIRAFREELREVERHGLIVLDDAQRARLDAWHDARLAELAARYDVDVSEAGRRMSWGMRIASFLGALAFCAAVYSFFYRFWGVLSTPSQVGLLVAAPIAMLFVTDLAARRERTLYVASLSALVALAAFVLNLSMLGSLFNITPTPTALLAFSAFAFLLAYTYGLRWLLAGGILFLLGYLAATAAAWREIFWPSFAERPENVLLAGLAIVALSFALPHRRRPDFPAVYRLIGLAAVLLMIFALSVLEGASYLPLAGRTVKILYQLAGFAVSGGCVAIGVRRGWPGVTNLGGVAFAVFLFSKFFDWWWDWMPKYLFFLIIGALALASLLALRRLRARAGAAAS